MADSDARPPHKSELYLSPMPSISASSCESAATDASLTKKLADLVLSDALPEPSGWEPPEDSSAAAAEFADADSSEKSPAAAPAAAAPEVAQPRFPRRPGEPDCTYYLKFGSCRFAMKCKFNHPPRKKKNRVKGSASSSNSNNSSNNASSPEAEQSPKEVHDGPAPESLEEAESLSYDDKGKVESKSLKKTTNEVIDVKKGRMEQNEPKPAEETEKGVPSKSAEGTDQKAAKEKGKEAASETGVQEECKYFSMPGGCKFGKACKYVHREGREGKTEVDKLELNFLGLPLRPGEKECLYYMRTGSCKFSTNCKFHHPDPTAVGSRNSVSEHQNGDAPQHAPLGSSQLNVQSWPDQRSSNEQPLPFLPPSPSFGAGMVPPHGIYPNPEWNGYQVPVNPYYPPGIHFQHFPPPAVNHPMYKAADIQAPSDEYPERPGQPDCQHFVKNGFCKFKLKCKYHHPKARAPSASTGGVLSPLGLPIKPDQPVCTYYGRYGVCKFGPACMYNHPFNFGAPVPAVGPALSSQYPTPGSHAV